MRPCNINFLDKGIDVYSKRNVHSSLPHSFTVHWYYLFLMLSNALTVHWYYLYLVLCFRIDCTLALAVSSVMLVSLLYINTARPERFISKIAVHDLFVALKMLTLIQRIKNLKCMVIIVILSEYVPAASTDKFGHGKQLMRFVG